MPFDPVDLTNLPKHSATSTTRLPPHAWTPILLQGCDFDKTVFDKVALNLIRNPNINSSHLFRADILYDSQNNHLTNAAQPHKEVERLLQAYSPSEEDVQGFELQRTIIRLMIPRNPQLDKPIAQTCYFLSSSQSPGVQQSLVIYLPHTSHIGEMPWYHPAVQSLAYLHTQNPPDLTSTHSTSQNHTSSPFTLSLHYRLFPSQTLPLPDRLHRTAHHLLSTIYKHGQGALTGYTKRVHHDQLLSQQRVQDTYTYLKRQHAKRLCDNWVEQTEPSKHVFEDLGIAAFLIELWKDMYRSPLHPSLPPFPGFVDLACGNGVLVDILLSEGYSGWGFDLHRRKTWSTFSLTTQSNLHQLLLIPQPLFHAPAPSSSSPLLHAANASILPPSSIPWHNGIFPRHTFLISNHADELTPWTPLLASLSYSPFLAIPCCSHNLSGQRFRAPSSFNAMSADRFAPSFFAKNVSRAKSIAITIPYGSEAAQADSAHPHADTLHHPPSTPSRPPSTGDLTTLSPTARASSKQPSAYASLCEWVAHLSREVGYVVEREVLRTPSTRNVGIVGRRERSECSEGGEHGEGRSECGEENEVKKEDCGGGRKVGEEEQEQERFERVMRLVRREGADGKAWVERGVGLWRGEGKGREKKVGGAEH